MPRRLRFREPILTDVAARCRSAECIFKRAMIIDRDPALTEPHVEKSGFMGRRSAETEGPHPVDIHVGQRVRMRRNQVGMFQTTLGADLGITFQQVQKYKRGSNRISPSKLYEIANALSVPITYFFEDLTPGDKIEREPVAALERHKEYLSSKEGCKLIDPMSKLPRSLRLKILPLLVALQPVDEAHDDGSDT